jgi:hypothetical protein
MPQRLKMYLEGLNLDSKAVTRKRIDQQKKLTNLSALKNLGHTFSSIKKLKIIKNVFKDFFVYFYKEIFR